MALLHSHRMNRSIIKKIEIFRKSDNNKAKQNESPHLVLQRAAKCFGMCVVRVEHLLRNKKIKKTRQKMWRIKLWVECLECWSRSRHSTEFYFKHFITFPFHQHRKERATHVCLCSSLPICVRVFLAYMVKTGWMCFSAIYISRARVFFSLFLNGDFFFSPTCYYCHHLLPRNFIPLVWPNNWDT